MEKKDSVSSPEALNDEDLTKIDGGQTLARVKPKIDTTSLTDLKNKSIDRRGSLTQINTHQSG